MIKNFWWENQSNRENWFGGPPSKERAYHLMVASTPNRNETLQKKIFLKIWNPLCELSCPFLRKSNFFLQNAYKTVSGSLHYPEVHRAHAWVKLCVRGDWSCVWEGTDGGNSVVNTVWAEGKTHAKHHWEEVSQENLMRQHSTGQVQAASNMLCICSFKKKSYKQKDFRCPKNHYFFNWTNLPGIQSHPISQEKILVQS